jgi:protocatechuate 3,4-dioxygenase beta subunit
MSFDPTSRRTIMQRWLATAALAPAAGGWLIGSGAAAQSHSCTPGGAATPAATEGPFFRPNTPLKRDFRGDAAGEPVTLTGMVLSRSCRPIAQARIELWHADARGAYDNAGFVLRGHQFTDAAGRFVFETIFPAPYSGRTPHYHVKVLPPAGRPLTTQLYFPDQQQRNARDMLFDNRLLLGVTSGAGRKVARFDFVLGEG